MYKKWWKRTRNTDHLQYQSDGSVKALLYNRDTPTKLLASANKTFPIGNLIEFYTLKKFSFKRWRSIKKWRFLVSGVKARISRTFHVRLKHVFLPLTEKNNIQPLAIKKECPKSQFTIYNLRAIWAILYFSHHVL